MYLCSTTKMLTLGTVTAVDALILFQTAGTNFILNFNSSFIAIFYKVAAATANMTDLSQYEYDWQNRLSHVNMTDSALIKYDWRRQLGGGDY